MKDISYYLWIKNFKYPSHEMVTGKDLSNVPGSILHLTELNAWMKVGFNDKFEYRLGTVHSKKKNNEKL